MSVMVDSSLKRTPQLPRSTEPTGQPCRADEKESNLRLTNLRLTSSRGGDLAGSKVGGELF